MSLTTLIVPFLLISLSNSLPVSQSISSSNIDTTGIETPEVDHPIGDFSNVSSSDLKAEHKIDDTYPSLDIEDVDSKDRNSFGNLISEEKRREEEERKRKEEKIDDRNVDRRKDREEIKTIDKREELNGIKQVIKEVINEEDNYEKSDLDKTGIPGLDEVMSILEGVLKALRGGSRGSTNEGVIKNPMENGAGCVDCDSLQGMNPFTAIFDQINTLITSLTRAVTAARKITQERIPFIKKSTN